MRLASHSAGNQEPRSATPRPGTGTVPDSLLVACRRRRDRRAHRRHPHWPPFLTIAAMPNLTTTLGRLHLQSPFLVASGTFGYAREMAGVVDFAQLGAIIP